MVWYWRLCQTISRVIGCQPEMEKSGIPFLPHDERYRHAQEWLRVVKAVWSGERVNFQGDYFHISDLCLRPRPIAQPHPRVYLGGDSELAQVLAAKEADIFILNGRPLEVIQNHSTTKMSQSHI